MATAANGRSISPLLASIEENLSGHIAPLARRTAGMTVRDAGDLLIANSGLASHPGNKIARARFRASEAVRRFGEVVLSFQTVCRPFSGWVGPGSRPPDLERRREDPGFHSDDSELGMSLERSELRVKTDRPEGGTVGRAETQQGVAGFRGDRFLCAGCSGAA